MKLVKRYTALFLALIMIIGLVPELTVNALPLIESGNDANGVRYRYFALTGTLEIGDPEDPKADMKDYTAEGEAPWYKAYWYKNVKRIRIDTNIKSIGDYSFTESAAKEVIFESGSCCNNIGKYAFYLSDIQKVNIPKSITEIRTNAFECSTSLTTVTIESGSTLKTIKAFAFLDCDSLDSITLPSSLKKIEGYAFERTGLTSVTIPRYCTSIGKYAFSQCPKLKSISVNGKNKNFSSKNGVLFNKKKSVLIQYPAGKTSTSYKVPSSVRTIKTWAFQGEEGLAIYPKVNTLIMPKKISKIEKNAFAFTDILVIKFPGKRPKISGNKMFDEFATVKIYYKKKSWPSKYRKKYGAYKVTWKKY